MAARFVTLFAALAGAAVAQNPVLDLMVFSNETSLVGNVVEVESSVTTVLVGCAAVTECPFGTEHMTLAQGPSTVDFKFTSSSEGGFPLTSLLECKLDGKVASCNAYISQGPYTERTTHVDPDYATLIYPVTITAGAEKISAATTTPRQTANDKSDELPSPKPTESVATPSPQASTSISTSTSGAAGNGTISSTTSKAAAPAVTQNAVLVGMAAVMGGVLAL